MKSDNISAKENKENKEKLKKEITPYIKATSASYIAKGYSIESILEAIKEVADELKSDGSLLKFKEVWDNRR